MKNREFYREEILKAKDCNDFVKPIIQKEMGFNCSSTICTICYLKQMLWLDDEYIEPKKSLLTDKEREWLQNLVNTLEPIEITNIEKYKSTSPYLIIDFTKGGIMSTTSFDENKTFLGLEPNTKYTLEELGIH